MNRKRYPKYETCDLMHNGICVSNPCICKGMSMSKKKNMKTEITHTPGPWKVEHSFGEMIIRDSEDYPIATMTDEDTLPEAKANAELIASAPLLQDELNKAVLQSAVYLKELKELKQLNKELQLKLSEFRGLFSDTGEVVED